MNNLFKKVRTIVTSALIAAIYAALTILLQPISYGVFQVRISEALTVLPFFSGFSVWGLFAGCLISNLFSPAGPLDVIFGSLATLVSAVITYYIGKSNLKFKKYIAPLPAVIINAVVVGILLNVAMIKSTSISAILLSMLWIGLGEAAACYIIGLPLLIIIDKNHILKRYLSDKD